MTGTTGTKTRKVDVKEEKYEVKTGKMVRI